MQGNPNTLPDGSNAEQCWYISILIVSYKEFSRLQTTTDAHAHTHTHTMLTYIKRIVTICHGSHSQASPYPHHPFIA